MLKLIFKFSKLTFESECKIVDKKFCLQNTKNSRKCRNCLSEKREIRGAQKLEISAINVSGDLSYAVWLCVLEERPFGLRYAGA
jgi:Zn finger protein HypA/HybF involved in hydrogenase expression